MSENITKILVPIDFSPHADRAFGYATALARRLGAELTLVHVVEDPFATGAWGAETYIPNIGELLQNLIAAAERQLTTLKDGAAAQGVRVKTAVITGRPAQSNTTH
jgi:nucleotide-binding universal stress UspA family protein